MIVDIIRILWIWSEFHGYPCTVDVIRILWIYPHFVDIVRILWISRIYPHFVDIICIGHIMSYVACNLRPIFHIYSSSVSDWCITYFPVFNLICFSVTYSFCLVRFLSEYEPNPNLIRIHVPTFITSIKDSFSFPLNFSISCCIGVLYKRVEWILCCVCVV